MVHRKAIETMIKTWGQTPKQIFTTSHASCLAVIQQIKKSISMNLSSSLSPNTSAQALMNTFYPESSIHNIILNVKWGMYVGSPEQTSPPVCVYKESCKKNIVSLVSLPNNEVVGLAQYKSLLSERPRETSKSDFLRMQLFRCISHFNLNLGLKPLSNAEPVFKCALEWCFYEDFIKYRTDSDKPSNNLLPIRTNEQVNFENIRKNLQVQNSIDWSI